MASLFQFSIRSLLAAVAFAAVGIAALLNANGIWEGLIWALALYALSISILMVVYRREELRAYWLGFAVCGGLYLVLLFFSQQSWLSIASIRYDKLLATQLAYWSHGILLPQSRRAEYIFVQTQQPGPQGMSPMPEIPGAGYVASGGTGMPPGAMVPTDNPNYVPIESFTQIFHALALLLAAAIGGKTCQVIYRTRPHTEE